MPPSTRRADYRRYRELVTERPDWFVNGPDGIQILLEDADIRAAQRHIAKRNRAIGLPPASASVGVLSEDRYVVALRDAIRFPDGSLGTHNRVIYANPDGVAVLAVTAGRIVLIRIYRHPVRRWMLEIPRGTVEAGHSLEQTVHQEMAEEVGGAISRMVHMGRTTSDTSLCTGRVDLYFAEIDGVGKPQLSEGIGQILLVTPDEFMAMAERREIEDAYALAAFAQARIRGLV
ncbi:NTP pyrophosphohydrolase [Paramagnetospirillum marisnigri]|uniref:GDP-mannose pyrophosphatase n=1 Tax=Paramagnetospirillum marisnigri TaxID=1285242 RepID=A0A178MMA5_9PROT|nr:NUDIX hydrolase [Paramagnetospirillum marisnigri]OAN49801.1 NTP pyrophosphohydrolase [Paramagnetospirillum marisnigri]